MSHQTRKSTSAKKTQSTSVRKKTATKKRKGWSDLSKNVRLAVIILIALVSVSAVLLGVYYAQLVENPFEEGTMISYSPYDASTGLGIDESKNPTCYVYYLNISGLSELEISELTEANFTDYFELEANVEFEVNTSHYYRFYCFADGYTGYYGRPLAGLNKVYLANIYSTLNLIGYSNNLNTTFNGTYDNNWTLQFSCEQDHGFSAFYNKTDNYNDSLCIKVFFDETPDLSWVDLDESFVYSVSVDSLNNCTLIELKGYAFFELAQLRLVLDDLALGKTEKIQIGHGDIDNFVLANEIS